MPDEGAGRLVEYHDGHSGLFRREDELLTSSKPAQITG